MHVTSWPPNLWNDPNPLNQKRNLIWGKAGNYSPSNWWILDETIDDTIAVRFRYISPSCVTFISYLKCIKMCFQHISFPTSLYHQYGSNSRGNLLTFAINKPYLALLTSSLEQSDLKSLSFAFLVVTLIMFVVYAVFWRLTVSKSNINLSKWTVSIQVQDPNIPADGFLIKLEGIWPTTVCLSVAKNHYFMPAKYALNANRYVTLPPYALYRSLDWCVGQ